MSLRKIVAVLGLFILISAIGGGGGGNRQQVQDERNEICAAPATVIPA